MYRRWVQSIQFSLEASEDLEEVVQEKSTHINLCRFFWEVVLYAFVLYPILAIMAIGANLIITPVAVCFALSFIVWKLRIGYAPNDVWKRVKELWKDQASDFFKQLLCFMALPIMIFVVGYDRTGAKQEGYRRYTTIRLFGRALYPIHAVLVLIGYVLYLAYQTNPVVYAEELRTIGWWVLYILGAIAIIVLFVLFFTTETSKVLRAYLHAKKTRVCPKVEFIDE